MRRMVHCAPGLSTLVVLIVACQSPRVLVAQVPWPCETITHQDAQSRCLALELSLADSMLAILRRQAQSLGSRLLDSAIRAQPAPPRAWLSLPADQRALLTTRFLLELLRCDLAWHSARGDSTTIYVTPIEARFRPDRGGRGIQMVITMYASANLEPMIALYSPLRDEHRVLDLVIMPSRFRDWGWQQGWTFQVGDIVESRLTGYFPYIAVAR